ncbi:MAG TPA: C25 family cysteine peptidase [bacterium]|nr:C25 family cysteine peptidase [bacterium]
MKMLRQALLLSATLAVSLAQAAVVARKLTFGPSRFHTEFAVGSLQFAGAAGAAWDTIRNAGHFGHVPRYELVLGDGMDVSDEPGAPQVPVEPVVIALEGHQQVASVTFEVGAWRAIGGQHLVLPCPKQQVLVAGTDLGVRSEAKSQKPKAKTVAATEPNAAIYQSENPYPTSVARWTGTSYRHDSTFVQVLVYPVRYRGAERRVEVCRKVEVKVEVEERAKAGVRCQMSDVRSAGAESGGRLADGGFEYVVVTGAGLDTVFQRLADWKTLKGVPAVVRTMDWVYAHYSGRDQAEQLRNYLKTLPDSGVKYVLLGGDVDVVPFRKAFAMHSNWGSMQREDSLPCDLYFAALQGSWDANNNNVFGEVDDSVDLHSDLSVGRAPVNDLAQAQTFVRKVMGYELGTAWDTIPNVGHLGHVPRVAGYQNKGLFFAMVLWQNPYTDQGVHKNMMEQQSFASGYSLTKLYQSQGNETRASVMQAMRENQNIMNHDGHGWYNVMECGGSANRMYTADADTITNSGLGVLYSIGCWTTAFDMTSIGEAFVTNPNGGTVATIGNSSYGWGSPGNPGFGYSDKFDNHFWHAVTSDGIYRIGDALAAAKEYYAPFSQDENVYRWHQYEINLMGDPEMPVWTALPETLAVSSPESIGMGGGRVPVTVMHGGNPVKGALVCLMKEDESYSRGLTDGAGQVWLDATPKTAGNFTLTVTAHNYLPVEQVIPCAVGPCVSFAGWVINDSLGNHDGIVNRSETILLPVWLRNSGQQASGPITMTLACDNPHVSIEDSTAETAPLAAGESVLVANAFRLTAAQNTGNGEALIFDLSVSDGGQSLMFHPVIVAGAAVLGLDRWWLTRPPLTPGHTGGVAVRIRNAGDGYGHRTWCRLSSLDTNVSVLVDSVNCGDVPPDSSGISKDSFTVRVAASCPAGHSAKMLLHLASDDFQGDDTLELLVGDYGFSDDMESGGSKWTHGGTGDLWHRTAYRTHSGTNAWYCANEASRLYNNNMDAWLTTVPFAVPQGCSLSFWRWFSTPNYGVDGIRVIVVRGAVEETLDFMGTGGALGERQTAKDAKNAKGADATGVPDMSRVLECGSEAPAFPGRSTPRPDESGSHAAALQRSSASRRRFQVRTGSLDHLITESLLNESSWAQEKYDLSWLGLGETIQVKLAFVSDPDTVDEGFYIDDVRVTGGGPPADDRSSFIVHRSSFRGLAVWPNPFRSAMEIRYGGSELPRLSVYDAAGRIVRQLPSTRSATWDGRDERGRRLPAGAYFIEARTASERRIAKVLMAY